MYKSRQQTTPRKTFKRMLSTSSVVYGALLPPIGQFCPLPDALNLVKQKAKSLIRDDTPVESKLLICITAEKKLAYRFIGYISLSNLVPSSLFLQQLTRKSGTIHLFPFSPIPTTRFASQFLMRTAMGSLTNSSVSERMPFFYYLLPVLISFSSRCRINRYQKYVDQLDGNT